MTPPESGREENVTHAILKMHLVKSTYKSIKDCLAAQHEQTILLTDNQKMVADDDDEDNDDEFFVVSLIDEMRLALFPAKTIVRDPHHCKFRTRHEQDLNVCST